MRISFRQHPKHLFDENGLVQRSAKKYATNIKADWLRFITMSSRLKTAKGA
jgi:hypothetical protein